MITGIHHVCIRCETEEDEKKVRSFYGEVLGLPVKREWDGGMMYDTGSGLIEVFFKSYSLRKDGSVQHYALGTDDVDGTIEKVRAAGYPITTEPRDVVIKSDPEFPIRIAFCTGPVGETIEIFHER